jgi:purine-nucleoside phosphorylase
MVIADHINLTWVNPLTGPVVAGDERFPDMSTAYDAGLRDLLVAVGRESGIPVHSGVYAGLMGPTYETPAEVRMLERLGADAVGMSTVPEVLVARAIGMRVAGVSLITNIASGLSVHAVTHSDVVAAGERAAGQFETHVTGFIAKL